MPDRCSSALRASFRLASAGAMLWGFHSMGNLKIDIIIRNQYGGHLQYLTIQGLIIAVATMLIGVLMDIVPPLRPVLRGLRRSLFIAAMPLAVVISSIYWTLLTFFPKLILDSEMVKLPPEAAGKPFRIPLAMDLGLHAVPAISLFFDFLVFERKYGRREIRVHAPLVVALYALFYGTWAEHCASKNEGIFPYPFLTHSSFGVRIAIYMISAAFGVGAFRLMNSIHPR